MPKFFVQPVAGGRSCIALEPIIDLANHARFATGVLGEERRERRNSLHSYVEAGQEIEGAAADALANLPERARREGCAVLYALEAVDKGQEILVSYRDLEVGGVLPAGEALRVYGFVQSGPVESTDPADWGYALGYSATEVGAPKHLIKR